MYNPEFRPIVKIREHIRLFPDRHQKAGYYYVEYIEPLHPITSNFGALAANTEGSDTEMTDLYVNAGDLAQWRVYLLDDFVITVKQPLSDTRYAAKSKVTTLSKRGQDSPMNKELPRNEIFVVEDEKVYFRPSNPTQYSQYRQRILCEGYRYVIVKLASKPDVWSDVVIGGW